MYLSAVNLAMLLLLCVQHKRRSQDRFFHGLLAFGGLFLFADYKQLAEEPSLGIRTTPVLAFGFYVIVKKSFFSNGEEAQILYEIPRLAKKSAPVTLGMWVLCMLCMVGVLFFRNTVHPPPTMYGGGWHGCMLCMVACSAYRRFYFSCMAAYRPPTPVAAHRTGWHTVHTTIPVHTPPTIHSMHNTHIPSVYKSAPVTLGMWVLCMLCMVGSF